MPIRAHLRPLYPVDWPAVSASIRFRRALGRCEQCGRPHGLDVLHLGDGRWWDEQRQAWRDGSGRRLGRVSMPAVLWRVRRTRVVLATCHLDHDPTNGAPANLAALCQRCHLAHDRPEHRRQRRLTLAMRRALGDLFGGPYA